VRQSLNLLQIVGSNYNAPFSGKPYEHVWCIELTTATTTVTATESKLKQQREQYEHEHQQQ